MLNRLGVDLQPPFGSTLIDLTDFATAKRYQEGSEIISFEDVQATLLATAATLEWGKKTIHLLLAQP